MMWSNDLLPLLANCMITEYDIRRGNTSIMRTFNLAPFDEIDYLESLPKSERNPKVGLLQRERPELAIALENGFDQAVATFLKENEIDQDIDVVAIRRDAVFVVNKPVMTTQFGDHITFVEKDQYHAYVHLNGKLEIFFRRLTEENQDKTRYDIDGFIRDEKEKARVIKKLKPGILSFIEEFIDVVEGTNFDRRKIYQFLIEFARHYKKKELELEYYREFTREAKFRIKTYDSDTLVNQITEEMLHDLDVSYNFLNVVIPLLHNIVK